MTGRDRTRADGQQSVVPTAAFESYYGRPVLKVPVWRIPEAPSYLFFGGLAGASSLLGAFAQLTGNRDLARASKTGAAVAIGVSVGALIVELGRPLRFLNMLRVLKVSSPMSIGSWLLASYGPVATAAATSAVTGRLPRVGAAASAVAAVLGSGVATYTAALLSDTAVPAWHEAHREMPYLFAGSAATAAGGLGMLATGPDAAQPAMRFAVLGAATELTAKSMLLQRLGEVAEPYQQGRPGQLMEAAEVLVAAGLAGAVLASRSRPALALSGLALLASSALTRLGIFMAGRASARDPSYTVGPQRRRRAEAEATEAATAVPSPPDGAQDTSDRPLPSGAETNQE